MSREIVAHRILLALSVLLSVISSAAILFVIIAVQQNAKWASIPISLLFWAGLIGEQICFWIANARLKRISADGASHLRPRIGILAVGQTLYGAIADVIFVLSLPAFLLCSFLHIGEANMQYVLSFLLVLSFRLHCILNGKNYWYSNLLLRRGKNE